MTGAKIRPALAILGTALLFLGAFTPVVNTPVFGNLTYFQNSRGDGIVLLVFAGLALVGAAADRRGILCLSGLGSLGVLAFTFVQFQRRISEYRNSAETNFPENLLRSFADAAFQSVQFEWGWAVLVLGAMTILAAAAYRERPPPP